MDQNQFIETARQVLTDLLENLLDPSANLPGALLGYAIIILIVMILLMLVWVLLASWPGRQPRSARARETVLREERPRIRGLRTGITVGVLAVLLVAGWSYTGTDRFCSSCHFTSQAVESWTEGAHSDTSCAACHTGRSASMQVSSRMRGARNLATLLPGARRVSHPAPAYVPSSACLACHEDVLSGTLTARSIHIRHSDLVERGDDCVDCHNTEAHGEMVARPQYPTMSRCIGCHDSQTASADCDVCHADDAGVAIRRPRRSFARVDVEVTTCRGCHEVETCNECHGLELPHSPAFVDGYHASLAYVDKNTCMRCHDLIAFCNTTPCHNFSPTLTRYDGEQVSREQHGPEFRSSHRSQSPSECEGCHGTTDLCEFCHGAVPDH